jgi:hypothetical protein
MRRRRVGLASMVVVGVACVVAVVAMPADDPAPADATTVNVQRDADAVVIEIVELDDPQRVVGDLRASGVDVRTLERPTGPSRVGHLVSLAVSSGEPQPSGRAFAVRVREGDVVEVGIGIVADEGASYDVGTDAFLPGEPLHCLSWPGQSTVELAEVTRGRLKVRAVDDELGPVEQLPADKVVVRATAIAADRVVVTVDDGAPTAAPSGCTTMAFGS